MYLRLHASIFDTLTHHTARADRRRTMFAINSSNHPQKTWNSRKPHYELSNCSAFHIAYLLLPGPFQSLFSFMASCLKYSYTPV